MLSHFLFSPPPTQESQESWGPPLIEGFLPPSAQKPSTTTPTPADKSANEDKTTPKNVVSTINTILPFLPLSAPVTHPPNRVADLSLSVSKQTAEFQLSFKQKQPKPAFKNLSFFARKRAAALRRQQSTKKPVSAKKQKEELKMMHRISKMKRSRYQQRRRWNYKSNYYNKPLESSIEIRSSWQSKSIFPFARLQKEDCNDKIKEMIIKEAGYTLFYNPQMDKVSARRPAKLILTNKPKYTYYSPKTMVDPVLQQLAAENAGSTNTQVYISDRLMGLIMSSPRSILGWDIVIIKKGNQIFFDKRNTSSRVDILTVDETSRTPPTITDEKDDPNHPENLGKEATGINLKFHQYVLQQPKAEEKKDILEFESPNPYKIDDQIAAPVAYRYKKFIFPDKTEIFCRCEIDGAMRAPLGGIDYLTIRSFNEYKAQKGEDFQSLLDTSPARVLITEIKNNNCKVARWVAQAMLAGTNKLKIGFATRFDPRNRSRHVVLGVETFNVRDFANQIGVKQSNMWGIIKNIVSEVSKMHDGKYVLVKHPNESLLQLYHISSSRIGVLVFRKMSTGYQFLLLKSGDRLVLPQVKVEQNESDQASIARALKQEAGLQDSDVSINKTYRFIRTYQEKYSQEEITEIVFAGFLINKDTEIHPGEDHSDFIWKEWNPPHIVDDNLDPILSDFQNFTKHHSGMERVLSEDQ